MNARMHEKVAQGKAIDLAAYADSDNMGRFLVPADKAPDNYHEGMDYCDLSTDRWIWSIGRHKVSGQFIASVTTEFYLPDMQKEYECVWLR